MILVILHSKEKQEMLKNDFRLSSCEVKKKHCRHCEIHKKESEQHMWKNQRWMFETKRR